MLTDRIALDAAYGMILLLTACAATGIVVCTLQTFLTVRLFRSRPRRVCPADAPPAQSPLISILKPVSGLEDSLRENLESFARLRGVRYELIISIADDDDPAIGVVKPALEAFPKGVARLIVGRGRRTANPKIERLIAAAAVARGDIFFISDSNVRVSPDDIARTVSEFNDPNVGCVSNIFIGEGARTLGALVESLYLLIFVVPGNVLAAWAEVPCVVGKSMALTRRLCEKLGGFEAFGQMLAEDQSIAVATKEAGYKVALSPIVVRNVIEKRSVRQAIQRQVRWGKLRFSFSKLVYSSEFLVNPFPMALLACMTSRLFVPRYFAALVAGTIFAFAHRLIQSTLLMYSSRTSITKLALILVPLQDLIQFASQVVPYVSKEVNWRGFRTRLGPNSLILAAADNPGLSREYAPSVLSST